VSRLLLIRKILSTTSTLVLLRLKKMQLQRLRLLFTLRLTSSHSLQRRMPSHLRLCSSRRLLHLRQPLQTIVHRSILWRGRTLRTVIRSRLWLRKLLEHLPVVRLLKQFSKLSRSPETASVKVKPSTNEKGWAFCLAFFISNII